MGGNYYPVYLASPSIAASSPWTITGTPQQATDGGTGMRNVRLTSSTPGPCTFVTTGAGRVILHWVRNPTAASFTYTVDGGSATNVDTTGTSSEQFTAFDVGSGSHTIVVQ